MSKFHEAGSILEVSFALSKLLHFHRVYLVTVCKQGVAAVESAYLGILADSTIVVRINLSCQAGEFMPSNLFPQNKVCVKKKGPHSKIGH